MRSNPILISVLSLILMPLAHAGQVNSVPVSIDAAEMFAEGDQWTARNSDNDIEYIGCGIRKFEDGAGNTVSFGFCQAQDSDGVMAFCNTDNAELLDAIHAMSAFSYINFRWDENERCTQIGSSTQSFYLPDFKAKKN